MPFAGHFNWVFCRAALSKQCTVYTVPVLCTTLVVTVRSSIGIQLYIGSTIYTGTLHYLILLTGAERKRILDLFL